MLRKNLYGLRALSCGLLPWVMGCLRRFTKFIGVIACYIHHWSECRGEDAASRKPK